jgi:hypothetical protein
MAKKRENSKTALMLEPLSLDEALAAFLKAPPPPGEIKAPTKKRKPTNVAKR